MSAKDVTDEAEVARAFALILAGVKRFALIIAERLAAGSPQAALASAQLQSFVQDGVEPALRALEALAGEIQPEKKL